MEPSQLELIKKAIDKSGLSKESKQAMGGVIKSVFDYFSFKLDPWKRLAHKKSIMDAVRKNQVDFVSGALQIITDRRIEDLKVGSEERIMAEVYSYLQEDVFLTFVERLKDSKTNWRGGTRKDSKEFYDQDSWWDLFFDLTNKRNESWRAGLFAEAMKVKTLTGDYLDYTALWKIAMLPPHSWIDLTQFLSLAGEIWVNGEYHMTVLPGTFSRISRLDYSTGTGSRRLVSDLDVSLTQDGLGNSETGPIVLRKDDENVFKLHDREYHFEVDEDYVDSYITDEDLEDTDFVKNYYRFFGIWLSKVGEEIIQLINETIPSEESYELFDKCQKDLNDDGVLIKRIK